MNCDYPSLDPEKVRIDRRLLKAASRFALAGVATPVFYQ
jgi:hypothetical protein